MKAAICQLLFFSLQNESRKQVYSNESKKRVYSRKNLLLHAELRKVLTRRKKEKVKSEPAPAPEKGERRMELMNDSGMATTNRKKGT